MNNSYLIDEFSRKMYNLLVKWEEIYAYKTKNIKKFNSILKIKCPL